jgi:uncharacterized membrane protein
MTTNEPAPDNQQPDTAPPPPPTTPPPPPPDPPPPRAHPPPPRYYTPAPRTNTLAIIALVLSLSGLLTCITAIIGLILGYVARREITRTGEAGDGIALAAIIIGWIITIATVLLTLGWLALVIFAINADPNAPLDLLTPSQPALPNV